MRVSSLVRRFYLLECAVASLATVSALCLASGYLSLGDRVSHFAFYWALFSLGVTAWAVRGKRWILGSFGALFVIVHGGPVASFWLPHGRVSQTTAGTSRCTLVSANLYRKNARMPDSLATLLELSPDVLLLMEVGPEWRPVLAPIRQRYPHSLGLDGRTWLLSKHPFRDARCTPITLSGSDSYDVIVEATVILPDTAFRLVGIHPPPPRGPARIAQQSAQAVEYAAALRRDQNAPHQILIGDFNTSPFSAVFRHIVQTTGLRDAAKGWGYQPTWGPRLPKEPLLPWLGIPIDHALVSDRVLIEDRRVGQMPGADHRYQTLKLRF